MISCQHAKKDIFTKRLQGTILCGHIMYVFLMAKIGSNHIALGCFAELRIGAASPRRSLLFVVRFSSSAVKAKNASKFALTWHQLPKNELVL
jgi:hypothetical protein